MQESKKLISAFRVKLNKHLIDWRSTAVDLLSPPFFWHSCGVSSKSRKEGIRAKTKFEKLTKAEKMKR